MTSIEGVFAAGDAVTGPWTVTQAIAMGRSAALSIHRYLKGEDLRVNPLKEGRIPPRLDQNESFLGRRVSMEYLPVGERLKDFEQVEKGYTEDMAAKEANRCLRCSLRLDITNT